MDSTEPTTIETRAQDRSALLTDGRRWFRERVKPVPIVLFAFLAVSLAGIETWPWKAYAGLIVVIVLGFVPGYLLLRGLGVRNLHVSHTVLYSVGSSLVFTAVLGVTASAVLPELGIRRPLEQGTFGPFVTLVIAVAWALVRQRPNRNTVAVPEVGTVDIATAALAGAILAAGAVAVELAPTALTHVPILTLLFGVITLLVLVVTDRIDPRLYPLVVFMAALALLYHTSLVSNYVWGWDIQITYHNVERILMAGQWSASVQTLRNPLVILLVVPAVISNLTQLSPDVVFTVLSPIMTALIPVGTYWIGREFLPPKRAVLAALLVPATFLFFTQVPGKQQLGEFYMVGLVLLILSTDRPSLQQVLFPVFALGLVFAHYSTAIVFGLVLFACGAYLLVQWLVFGGDRPAVTLGKFATIPVFIIGWYMYVSENAIFFNLFMVPLLAVRQLLTVAAGSDQSVQSRTGLYYLTLSLSSLVQQTYRLLHISVFAFLAAGGIAELPTALRGGQNRRQAFVYGIVGGFVLLFAVSVLAHARLGIDRVYEWGIVIFAPLVVLGWFRTAKLCRSLWGRLPGRSRSVTGQSATTLFASLLVVFLLFNAGVVQYATDTTGRSFPMQYPERDYPVFEEGEVRAASWLHEHTDETLVYGDEYSRLVLSRSFGQNERIRRLRPNSGLPAGACLFYRKANVQGRIVLTVEEQRRQLLTSEALPPPGRTPNQQVYAGGSAAAYCRP